MGFTGVQKKKLLITGDFTSFLTGSEAHLVDPASKLPAKQP